MDKKQLTEAQAAADANVEIRTTTGSAREFIEDTQERITQEELPILAHYLMQMIKVIMDMNDKVQLDAEAQGVVLVEYARMMVRLVNLIHQLMNTKPLLELLEKYAKKHPGYEPGDAVEDFEL